MRRCAALWLVSLWACTGVGRSLVDHRDQPKGADPLGCINLPSCDMPLAVRGSTLGDALPALLVAGSSECKGRIPELCAPDPEAPGGGLPAPVECAPSFSVEQDDARELAQIDCTGIRIVAESEIGIDQLVVDHASWQHAHVAIESARPLTVLLSESALKNVRIELTGPVTLQLQKGGLGDVQVLGRVVGTDAPRLSMEESESDKLTVRGEMGAFPGRLALVRSTLEHGWLGVQTLDLESVKINDARLQTERLDADDVELEDVSLSVDEGRAVASTLRRSEVRECGSLTLISSDVHGSVLGPCTADRLRAYSVFAQESAFVGPLESEGSDIRDSWLGSGVATQLESWNSVFQRVALCAETQASFGANSSVTCSTCAREASLCKDPEENVALTRNECPQLVDMRACKEPLDEPGRP